MEESWSKRNRLLEGQKDSKNHELDGKRKQEDTGILLGVVKKETKKLESMRTTNDCALYIKGLK